MTQNDAYESLMEQLLDFVPPKAGNTLDFSCGLGAAMRHPLSYYQPKNIVAINLSDVQLARAPGESPGCPVLAMNATNFEINRVSGDNVICAEFGLHFDTRNRFLGEAYRMSRPQRELGNV